MLFLANYGGFQRTFINDRNIRFLHSRFGRFEGNMKRKFKLGFEFWSVRSAI